jgi:hypothetical protein
MELGLKVKRHAADRIPIHAPEHRREEHLIGRRRRGERDLHLERDVDVEERLTRERDQPEVIADAADARL